MNDKYCLICGRKLKEKEECQPGDLAMDCGGDCLSCVQIDEDES